MKNKLGVLLLMLGCVLQIHAEQVFDMASFGIVPNGKNLSAKMEKAIAKIKKQAKEDSIVMQFQKGRYDFYPEKAPLKHYYISNHAEYYGSEKPQDNPLRVGIALEDFQSLRILKNEGNRGITFEVFSETDFRVTSDSIFETYGLGRWGIRPMNNEEKVTGAYEFAITFEDSIDSKVAEGVPCCMENLTWTPEVYFTGNTIRNNRARGSLFTTPRKVVVENNVYDHVSGSAILLSGDCSYCYESGACRDVLIRKNRFINVLSSLYMEADAVI